VGIIGHNSPLGEAIDAHAGWHGQGHQIYGVLRTEGLIDRAVPEEPLADCVAAKFFVAHDIAFWRVTDAEDALVESGVATADITPSRLAAQIASDDPSAFLTDPVELAFIGLVCAGIPEASARAMADDRAT
jgi:hypothetical protein